MAWPWARRCPLGSTQGYRMHHGKYLQPGTGCACGDRGADLGAVQLGGVGG